MDIVEEGGNKYDNFIDKVLDVFYSEDKTALTVLSVFVLGLILRFIAAINIRVAADDMHFAVHAINFLNSGKLVVYDQSASLWYYLTDISYSIFNISQLTSRSVALLFGAFSIILMYLFVKEFYGKKAGMFAAVLLAVSPFHIKNTISEMDVAVMFFIIFSLYTFGKGLKNENKKMLIFSGILLGLAILTKVYSLLFIPVMITYALSENWKKKGKIFDKKYLQLLLIVLGVAFIFAIPSLTHNYLLYKDKGIVDLLYANTAGIAREASAPYYSWDTGWGEGADWPGFFFGKSQRVEGDLPTGLYAVLASIFANDFIVGILGLLGIFFAWKKKDKRFLVMAGAMVLFVYIYLAARILLIKHYIFLLYIFVPLASLSFVKIDEKIRSSWKKYRSRYLVILIILVSLVYLGFNSYGTLDHFYSKSATAQVIDFKNSNIPEDALIVGDARIYRGEIHWMFNSRNYMESALLERVLETSESLNASKSLVDVYYVECVPDDCGWGTIKDQPEFNASSEAVKDFFADYGTVVSEINIADGKQSYFPIISDKNETYYRIYKTQIPLVPQILPALKANNIWFLYPIGYDESIGEIFDNYEVHGVFDKLLNSLAHAIVICGIALAFISIIFLMYLFFYKK